MQDIDFLPPEFRQRHARHRHQTRRLALLGVGAAVLALAALGQQYRRQQARAELEMIEPVHAALVAQGRQLASLQAHLHSARATAELATYLRHPWPRTRILDEVLRPLPGELTLQRLAVDRTPPEVRGPAERRSRSDEQAEEARRAAMPPATRDLNRLRGEADPARTVVSVEGVTRDSAALHRYLAALEKCEMFSKAELVDVESSPAQTGLRFSLMLVVRPGYGQPGGPTPPAVAARDPKNGPESGRGVRPQQDGGQARRTNGPEL